MQQRQVGIKPTQALLAYIAGLNTAITQSAAAQAAAVAALEATGKAVAGAEAATSASNAAIAASNAAAAAASAAATAAADEAAAMIEAAEAAKAAAEALAGLSDAEKKKILDEINGGSTKPVEELPPGINTKKGDLIALASGGIVTSPTMALIGEAGPEAVIPLSGSGIGGNITITINNAGSVIAEADLVSGIRNALLQAQNNGQVITKSAVAI